MVSRPTTELDKSVEVIYENDDIGTQVSDLSPSKSVTSRFSIHNPMARFSIAPD